MRAKIALPLLLLGVAMVISAQSIVHQSVLPTLNSSLEERGEAIVSATHYASETMSDVHAIQQFVSALAAEHGVIHLGIVSGSPPRVVASNRGAWRNEEISVLPTDIQRAVESVLTETLEDELRWKGANSDYLDIVTSLRWSQRALGKADQHGAVFLRIDAKPLQLTASQATTTMTLVLIGFTALFGFLALFLVHRVILRPLNSLGRAMGRRTAGDQQAFAPRLVPDEIGQVASQLDTMLHALDAASDEVQIANRSKTDFLANMSHEIRTPMTAILGFTDTLLDPGIDAQETRQATRTIQRNCLHLLQLLDDILDVSKIEAGRVEIELVETPLPQLLVDVHRLMQPSIHSNRLSFGLTFSQPIPALITTDATRLKQVLLNLVGNAVKFTEKGSIELRCGLIEDSRPPTLVFEVEDTGIGMSHSQVDKIFAPFTQADASTTRRFGGTGLGLTISRSLAEILGGSLTVESTPGVGSTFRLETPAVFAEGTPRVSDVGSVTPSTFARKKRKQIPHIGASVLIAEDGLDNQLLIGRLMERAGCAVTIVNNGAKAVAAVEKSGAAYDIILMDMQMPEMDGYTAARILRDRGFQLPIVALTAHAMTGDREKCLEAGCSGYATKPVDREALFSIMLELLGYSITS